MNIFILDADPVKCAEYHFDIHVNKMLIEAVQMLSTVNRLCGIYEGYEMISNPGHGCVKWLQRSLDNVLWTRDLVEALHREWQYRYNKLNNHLSYYVYLDLKLPPIENKGMTYPYMAMPFGYKRPNFIEAYRRYYKGEKFKLAKWTKRDAPVWWEGDINDN